jgi:peptidoglycan/xylan/chitin deacetylase (PgdA/CDA1 family)
MTRIYFVITIDTEADHQNEVAWRRSDPLTFHSITEGITHRLAPVLKEYGARPTFLLTYEVLEQESVIRVLAGMQNCELGAHLHAECVPPGEVNCAGISPHGPQYLYPYDVERSKLHSLVEQFTRALGYAPRAFRAGAFGADGETLRLLAELGLDVDTSVTPNLRWNFSQGALDFSRAPEQPYFPSFDEICEPGHGPVLEVPVTISKLRSRLLRPRPMWLRPSTSTAEQMIRVIDDQIARHAHQGTLVLNMMFHSMEIIPNASPYTRSEAAAQEFLERIRRVLRYVQARGAEFVTLSELADAWRRRIPNATR